MRTFTTGYMIIGLILAVFIAPNVIAAGWDAAERQDKAMRVFNDLAPIYQALPSLSPKEKSWLEQELGAATKSANSGRFRNVANSREYQIHLARKYLEPAHSVAKALTKKTGFSRREEALLWSIIAHSLMQSDLYIALDRLARMKILNKSVWDAQKESRDLWLRIFASDALEEVVIPYLNIKLPN